MRRCNDVDDNNNGMVLLVGLLVAGSVLNHPAATTAADYLFTRQNMHNIVMMIMMLLLDFIAVCVAFNLHRANSGSNLQVKIYITSYRVKNFFWCMANGCLARQRI